MAVRKPVIYSAGSLQNMTQAQVNAIVDQAVYQYGSNPSVTLSVVGSSGTLNGMTDSRLQAGTYITRVDRYATEGETAEPSTVNVTYDRVSSASASVAQMTSGDTVVGAGEGSFPFYYDAGTGSLVPMTHTDMLDTFIRPAISKLVLGTISADQAGTYHVHTSTTYSGSTNVSATPIFTDTRANTAAYTAGGIPETLDQPTTISNFYLMRIDPGAAPANELMFRKTAAHDLQRFTVSEQNTMLANMIRWAAVNDTGYIINYQIGTTGSGQTRGSGMTDTKLNGSGNYQTRFVNTNDYRAQEFPNGTAVTQNTYYLRIFTS